MKHLVLMTLGASLLMAAADKPGGGSSQADEARAKAQAAKDAQADADKAKADKEAKAAQDRSDGGGAQDGPVADAVKEGLAPPVDAEGLDPKALLARLDAQDRLIQSLMAQAPGGRGPAPDEAKDTQVAASGAAIEGRLTRVLPPGVSSAPALQPMPASDGGRGGGIASLSGSALLGEAGASRASGRSYAALDEEDVVVIATGYHDDTIRNAGDVIRGYTGPAGSWFVPKDMVDKLGVDEAGRRWKRELAEYAAKAAA